MTILRISTARPRVPARVTRRVEPGHPFTADERDGPAWVLRMHADGRALVAGASWAPLRTGSQRFIEHWSRVSCGY